MAAYPMLPQLLPHGMDPAAVDFRTFFPYQPNEVKHRKRTTSAQLKVLENIFKTDTKPNAALRQRLAGQLDMTPRGVQVWFQNRRAKEKLKAGKVAAASKSGKDEDDGSSANEGTADGSDLDVRADGGQQLEPFNVGEGTTESPPPPFLQVSIDDSANSSYQSTPLSTPDDVHPQHSLSDAQLYGLRRGSLPVSNCFPPTEDHCAPPPNFDRFARRRSVDANLHRLATNPYASYARNKHLNVQPIGRQSRFSGPNFQHRPSMPAISSAAAFGSSPSPLSHYAPRNSLPEPSLQPALSRPLAAPIPSGPLPQPGFSFGAATPSMSPPSGENSQRSSPDNQPYQLSADGGLAESSAEDDYVAYVNRPRFGSIASTTSNGSGYYSEIGNGELGFVNIHRRASSTSLQMVGLMSNLDVNGESSSSDATTDSFASPIASSSYTQSPPLNQDIQNVDSSTAQFSGYSFPPDGSAQMFNQLPGTPNGLTSHSPPTENGYYFTSPPTEAFDSAGNPNYSAAVDFSASQKYPENMSSSNPSIFDPSFPANNSFASNADLQQQLQSFAWTG